MKQKEKIGQKPQNTDKKSAQKFKIKSWYSNRYQIVVVQRNILLLLSVCLLIAMTASIVFVKYVVSSKSLEPYVIEVEEKSGIPTVVDQLTTKVLTADESVKKYFINQFIQSAVAYNPKTYRADAERVRLLSSQGVYTDFRNRIKPRDLGTDSKKTVKIKSMRFPDSTTVQIRIARTSSGKSGTVSKDEVITMNFYFTNLKLTSEERLVNPLGFQVSNFIIIEEIFDY
jgi:type IV secretion system protein VirB8